MQWTVTVTVTGPAKGMMQLEEMGFGIKQSWVPIQALMPSSWIPWANDSVKRSC